jgi:hypothetical protein
MLPMHFGCSTHAKAVASLPYLQMNQGLFGSITKSTEVVRIQFRPTIRNGGATSWCIPCRHVVNETCNPAIALAVTPTSEHQPP